MDDSPGRHPLTASTRGLIPDGLDATLVLVRHGESTFIAEGPLPGPGRDAALADRHPPGPADGTAAGGPASGAGPAGAIRPTRRARSFAAATDGADGRRDRRGTRRRGARRRRRSDRSSGSGLHGDRAGRLGGPADVRDRGAIRHGTGGLAPPAAGVVGARRRVDPGGRRAGASGAGQGAGAPRRRSCSRFARFAGSLPGRRLRRARRRTNPGRSSSPTTASSRWPC